MRFRSALFISCICLLPSMVADAQASIVVQPHISGISNEAAANNTTLRMQETIQNLPQPLAPSQAENFYFYSDAVIAQGLAPFGYFGPRIDKQLVKNNEQWQLDYQVTPGQETKINAVDIQVVGEGTDEKALQLVVTKSPLLVGDFFVSPTYETYKKKLLEEAQALGYIDVRFVRHEVLVNRAQASAHIYLTLDTGPRYYFGRVHFSKNPLNDHFLQRFVPFTSGEIYSTAKTNQLETNLKDSNYFSDVLVVPDRDAADINHVVPIQVDLKKGPRRQYIFGLGYGTDTGPRATIGSNWRYVNAYGHRFNTMLRLSQVQSTASAKYIIPGVHPLTDEYNINASLQHNYINQGSGTVKQIGAGYTYTLGSWQRTISLSDQIERYSFFGDPYQTSRLLLPGFGVQHVSRNDILFPTEGQRFSANIIGAKQGIASDTSMVQATVHEKWIHSFNDHNIILLRTGLGYTTIHNDNLLPLSLSFFAGGAQSIRGYGYNALGPGRYLLVGSAEYRYRVFEKWYAASFFDVGNAFNNLPIAPHTGFKSNMGALYHLLDQGAGVGVVWNSPVGAMELTYAKEMNITGMPSRVQFNLGTDL